ncbi:hypothetical protein OAT16_00695 [Prolixibacteraceae bacterium]|nr:hypothetical protein [Prolixibacteraceae bacterium]
MANRNESLDEHVFLCDSVRYQASNQIAKGYRAFIVSSIEQLSRILDSSYNFLNQNNQQVIVLIFSGRMPTAKEIVESHKIYAYLAIQPYALFQLNRSIRENKRLVIFSEDDSELFFSRKDKICFFDVEDSFPNHIESSFTGNISNDLVVFNIGDYHDSDHKISVDTVPILFNSYTGKLPNFFLTKYPEDIGLFKEYIGNKKWNTAEVVLDGVPLDGVSWKEMKEMTSYGKIHTFKHQICPQKDGFRFSPDVFQFNRINSYETKIFHASSKELLDGLILYLDFRKNGDNLLDKEKVPTYSKLRYVKDHERNWCADFNGQSDYIDYASGLDIKNNLTLSVWVKPDNIYGDQSILGKGETLSVKFRDGKLLFTSPGIKDHFTDSIVVNSDEWQHISYVFSANKKLRFYINGVLIGEQKAAPVTPTNNSVLIGTNIWDEYYHGKMDDLAIWNRSLSDDEILRIYQEGIVLTASEEEHRYLLGVSILIMFGLMVFGFIYIKGSNFIDNLQTKDQGIRHFRKKETKVLPTLTPFIQLLGGFKMINRDGNDITSKFSTRRKQLFILILLSKYKEGGISSRHLTDSLWPGYSSEKAKNNRSTQMKRLREILDLNTGVSIDFRDKTWCVNIDDDVSLDLEQYYQLKSKIIEEQYLHISDVELLLDIVEKGSLLLNLNEIWLDDFKSHFEDKLIDFLIPLFENVEFCEDHNRIIRLSNILFIYDPLNEIALDHKVRSLVHLGKSSLAGDCISHFSKIYQQYYNQPYNSSVSVILDQRKS